MKGVKSYTINTFLFLRLLNNPKIVKNFQKIFVFRQELEVWCSHNSSNLTSVETFWSHEFVEEFWHCTTHENGAILGGTWDAVQCALICWWDWSKRHSIRSYLSHTNTWNVTTFLIECIAHIKDSLTCVVILVGPLQVILMNLCHLSTVDPLEIKLMIEEKHRVLQMSPYQSCQSQCRPVPI